jgi:hypothetical protein
MIHICSFVVVLAVAQDIGQRGTRFVLPVAAGAEEIHFYQPGLKVEKIVVSKTETQAHLFAPADCRLGEYAYRVRTTAGFSPLATLRVTPFPVVESATERHTTPATAQKIALNVSVRGKLDSEDVACYAVHLEKGQRLSAEIEGVRLGRGAIDLALRIQGPDGTTLAEVDDTALFRQDPFISLRTPMTGTYILSVSQSGSGRDSEPYVLHVGDFVRPQAIFPAGGQAGKKVRVQLLGDADNKTTQEVTLPDTPGAWEFYPQISGKSAPTPHPFRVSDFPDLTESGPSDNPATALRADTWPVAFNGIISQPAEQDYFRFCAKKDQAIEIQAYAWRIGSPLDSVVSVFGPDGRLLGHNDDDETHDSRIRFVAEVDGDHVIRIADKRKAGGPLYFYRIEVDRPRAEVGVFHVSPARKSQAGNSIAIPQGNRILTFLGVQRKGHDKHVTITPGALPRGVRMTPAQAKPGEYLVPVVLDAQVDAPLGGLFVPFTAKADGLQGRFTQVVDLARGPGDSALHSVVVDRLPIAVIEPIPYRLHLIPPATYLSSNGTLEVRVQIERDADFTGALDVSLPLLPHGVEAPAKVTVPAEKSEALFQLVASGDAVPGDWPLIAEARVSRSVIRGDRSSGVRRPRGTSPTAAVASAPVMLKVLASPLKATIAPVAGELGQTVEVVCQLEGHLPARMEATLDGLPPRAKSNAVVVLPGERTIRLQLTLDPTTPTGKHETLCVVLSGEKDKQKLSYRVGQGGTIVAVEPGKRAIGKDGKPLSPLEALRAAEKP